MFRRKLAALNHPASSTFDPTNDEQFKNFIVWIEDQKIRFYKIEDRGSLRSTESSKWEPALQTYLEDLKYPFNKSDHAQITDWLLGHAVSLEYGDNVKECQQVTGDKVAARRNSAEKATLHNIDANDPDFVEGVRKLADVLKIPLHPDPGLMLEAVKMLIDERLSEAALANPSRIDRKKIIPVEQLDLGFDTGDPMVNRAACALRLLHIKELRELQTDVNNAIVAVQAKTANPKTDERLGKVGRS